MELAKRFSAHHRPEQPIVATVGGAIAAARAFAEGCRLAPDQAMRLAVVVDELVGNVLRHGRQACDVFIDLTLSQAGDGDVVIVLEDDGLPFDPRETQFDGPDEESGGGVGLALVRAFAEIGDYRRREGINRLSLRLRAPPRPD